VATVIVGAGIIGLACAFELLQRGEQVVLIDQGEPGAACSAGNAGWVVPAMSAPVPSPGLVGTSLRWMLRRDSPLYIRPRIDPKFALWLLRFWANCRPAPFHAGLSAVAEINRQTMEGFDRWRSEGLSFEMRQAGVIFAGLSARAVAAARADVERLTAFGYAKPESLSATELRALEPALSPGISGGFLVPDERLVRPESLTAALRDAALALGGEIRARTTVTGFRRTGRRIDAVTTETGDVPAERVLLCAGAWSVTLARRCGTRLPVEAGKGYSLTIDLADDAVPITRPIDFIEARVACTPFAGALRLAGTMELSGLNLRLEPARVAPLRNAWQRYAGELPSGTSETAWVGMRPMTPDGLPLIGPLPGIENGWVATGHAMLGVTLAPNTASAISNAMLDSQLDPRLAAFDPGRFHRKHR
jgi:D-amino-acid dehydrogenase